MGKEGEEEGENPARLDSKGIDGNERCQEPTQLKVSSAPHPRKSEQGLVK